MQFEFGSIAKIDAVEQNLCNLEIRHVICYFLLKLQMCEIADVMIAEYDDML